MRKILITGAAGFIGFHLAKQLIKEENIVVGLDNFNSYYDPALKRSRSKELQVKGVHIVEADIHDEAKLKEIVSEYKITHIVHLAAQAGVRYSTEQPQIYIKTNIDGFLSILEICRHQPEIQLIYASSSSVYGLNTKVPFNVNDKTDKQASLYGVTKKCNELMAFSYHHLYDVKSIGLRFFTVYGPWGRPDMAYYRFTRSMLLGEKIPIYNYGNMERDFTYIDDIIQGIIAAINKGGQCEVYNLGNHRPEKLMRLVEILENCLSVKANLDLLPMQPGDVTITFADIESSRSDLGFEPKVSLEEGLSKFVKWYKTYNTELSK